MLRISSGLQPSNPLVLLPSRLKFQALAGRPDISATGGNSIQSSQLNSSISVTGNQQSIAMSTDAAVTTTSPSSARAQQNMLAAQRAKEQEQAEEKPRSRPGFPSFPLGYKDAVYQWWNSASASAAERNVLNHMPYIREAIAEGLGSHAQSSTRVDPFGPRVWRKQMVKLSGKNRALNEFSVEREGEEVDDTLVMLHGYGAGLGFFYQNFEPLSRAKGWRLYALDMLGMGNSARPPFKIHARDQQGKINEAEAWFVDSLEEWRKVKKIEKFTLLGHSLGGYLAVRYALKYPGHLNKLILASPVGVPEDPYAVNAAMPEPQESAMVNEFTDDQESIVNGSDTGSANGRTASDQATQPTSHNTRRPYPGWLVWLWDANVSPFSIVRMAGPLGPRFVSGWTSRRFNHLPEEEAQTLHSYAFSLFRQKGSGEYALPYLLAPGAFARSPIVNSIQDVGRQVLRPAIQTEPAVRETGIPIVFMYGENDWMDVAGGYASEEKVKQATIKALLNGTPEEQRCENGSAKVVVVRQAGHHLYLDNPDEFNEAVRKELDETRQWGQRQKALQQ